MAHFAKIENDVVTDVIVVDNADCGGGNFPESEPLGQAFISSIPGIEGFYKQTSYSGSFRGKYASKGDAFDEVADIFISPDITELVVE